MGNVCGRNPKMSLIGCLAHSNRRRNSQSRFMDACLVLRLLDFRHPEAHNQAPYRAGACEVTCFLSRTLTRLRTALTCEKDRDPGRVDSRMLRPENHLSGFSPR